MRKSEGGKRENRQMALGGAFFQDALARLARLRAWQDYVNRTASQTFAGSSGRRHLTGEGARSRLRNRSAGPERNTWPGFGCADALPRNGSKSRIAEKARRGAQNDAEFRVAV